MKEQGRGTRGEGRGARGQDEGRVPRLVIPAKAGIQFLFLPYRRKSWIPAFAGMTRKEHNGLLAEITPRERRGVTPSVTQ